MSLVSKRIRFALRLLAAGLLSASASAELRPLDDGELSAVAGQGLINLDALTYGGYEYTRAQYRWRHEVADQYRQAALGQLCPHRFK
ncbi:MAG: hypothetical protein U5M72_10515 [Pseudomonas sp.]|nr:hypothetical protein [Pseudomonas sp.]